MSLNWSFENRVQTKEHRKGLFTNEKLMEKFVIYKFKNKINKFLTES